MTDAEKQVQQANLDAEQKILDELQKVYQKALDDCTAKITELNSNSELQDLQSTIYQRQYQEMLEQELTTILDDLQTNSYSSIEQYLTSSYTNGYTGAMYSIADQGIPVISPIDQNQVVKALQTNSKLSTSLYNALGEDINYLKNSIRAELSRGIANGSSWLDMAQRIATGMNSPWNRALANAMRIARTEGHRIQQEAALDAMQQAKDKGADVVKQWDATLDNRTRPAHQEADGQIREMDEPFDVGGEQLDAPGVGGSAANVINCRCVMLQRARWALTEDELKELQDRADYFGLDKTDDFNDFKEKYLQAVESGDIISTLESATQLLKSVMSAEDYNNYMDLLKNNPDHALQELYRKYADKLSTLRLASDGDGYYDGPNNLIKFSYATQGNGMSRYDTLAHEMGHFFDAQVQYDGLTYNEVNAIKEGTTVSGRLFKTVASSSDQFLEAVRKDKTSLSHVTKTEAASFTKTNASAGVQDAINGLLKVHMTWGHDEAYWNKKYNGVVSLGEEKAIKQVYNDLGMDASNQAKVKNIVRNYSAASETWAEITAAETCGGEALEYIKKYLPNSYDAYIKIIGSAK